VNNAEELFYSFFDGGKDGEFLLWKLAHSPEFKTEHPLNRIRKITAYFSVVGSDGYPEVYGDKPSIVSIKDVDSMNDSTGDPIYRHISTVWWCQSRGGYHRKIEDGPALVEMIANQGKIIQMKEKYYLDGKRVARPKKSLKR